MQLAVPLIVLVIIAAFVLWGVFAYVGQQSKRREEIKDAVADPASPTLRYHVPEGQDPAVLLTALERDGWTATTTSDNAGLQDVLVTLPEDSQAERARVRAAITRVRAVNMEGDQAASLPPVRFADE
jgi:hypothetical protein